MSSVVLAKSAATAEDRLVQAIKRFEAQLSPDQREIYTKNQGLSLRPEGSEVSKLLGEVDRLVKAKHGTRSAFKPRLESVVMAIQKSASIGDVMIGGSQNLIACGVWSIARIALLVRLMFDNNQDSLRCHRPQRHLCQQYRNCPLYSWR